MPILNLNKFSKIQDETIKDLIPLIIVFGKDKIIDIARQYDANLYVTNSLESLANVGGLECLIRREGVDNVRP